MEPRNGGFPSDLRRPPVYSPNNAMLQSRYSDRKASVLYALEVPSSGGDTSFCSMYAAWDALPDWLKRRVDGARVKHDGTYNSGGYTRQGVTPSDDPRTSPGTLHSTRPR